MDCSVGIIIGKHVDEHSIINFSFVKKQYIIKFSLKKLHFITLNYISITLYILNFLNTYFTFLNYDLYYTLHTNIKVTVNLDKGWSQRGRGGTYPPFLAYVVYSSYSLVEKKRKRKKWTPTQIFTITNFTTYVLQIGISPITKNNFKHIFIILFK